MTLMALCVRACVRGPCRNTTVEYRAPEQTDLWSFPVALGPAVRSFLAMTELTVAAI